MNNTGNRRRERGGIPVHLRSKTEWFTVDLDDLLSIQACDGGTRRFVEAVGETASLDPTRMALLIEDEVDLTYFLDEVLIGMDRTKSNRIKRELGWGFTYAALGDLTHAVRESPNGDRSIELGLPYLKEYARLVRLDTRQATDYREANDLKSILKQYKYRRDHLGEAVGAMYEALWSLEISGGPGEDGGRVIDEVLECLRGAINEMRGDGHIFDADGRYVVNPTWEIKAVDLIPRASGFLAKATAELTDTLRAGIERAHGRNFPDTDYDDEDGYDADYEGDDEDDDEEDDDEDDAIALESEAITEEGRI